MKPAVQSKAPKRPTQPTHNPSSAIPSSSVFGFPVSVNQYQLLQDSRSAVSQSSRQNEDKLIDPRSTRLSRQQAARGTEEQGTLYTEGILNTVPPVNDAQGIFDSRDCVEPVASGNNHSFFPHSLSGSAPDFLESQSGGNVQNLLEIGVYDDAMYNDDVNEVTCMERNICKRISNAGQEWSAGRPGNRPIIIGARTAARNTDTCLGPYAARAIQSPSTDNNNRAEEQASSSSGRLRHQDTI